MVKQTVPDAARWPESTGTSDPPLRLESTLDHGDCITLARDSEGHVAYPTRVPPETTSPISPVTSRHPTMNSSQHGELLQSGFDGSRKANADPPSIETPRRPNPFTGRKWVTEIPKDGGGRSFTLPLRLRRAGTRVSHLNQPLGRQQLDGYDESSTSEFSSGDESEQETGLDTAGKPHKQQRPNEDRYSRFDVANAHYRTKGKVSRRDGRLNIMLHDKSDTGYLAKALDSAVGKVMPRRRDEGEVKSSANISRLGQSPTATAARGAGISCPSLNIVIMVIGSRGDAQPFLKIGKLLKEQHGHRVRIATHPAFRDFVEKDSGLEFFSVGGDPSELMAFMVKNPGMIPTLETVKAGDIGKRRAAMAEMFGGFWRACINATDDEKDTRNVRMMGDKDPFVADAIIANPPSFAHIHCAEALGIPLHIMFTFPYTPTQAFPHPLASIKKSNVDPGYTNFISYPLVEMMVWQGLGDLVNDFRIKTLGLDPVSTLWAPGALYRLHVPVTYLWSPVIVPKPEDWGDEIDVSGFVFLDLASSFTPTDNLKRFLDSGEAPIYIGFGSIVVDDADRFTEMIFEAIRSAGVRALVSKGWGGLGGDSIEVPDNIFLLDNTPHDWLFPRVRACVIHGGAGTTAIALKCGKPTFIVPFFGDQHFWGSMVAQARAGPEPIPYKHLTAEKLAEGIRYCLTREAIEAAKKIASSIEQEGDGAENACSSFHRHLSLTGKKSMRCSILESRAAAWHLKKTNIRLSPLAAHFLTERGYLPWRKLRLVRSHQYNDFEGPGEPLTGAAGSLLSSLGDVFAGVGGVPYRIAKSSTMRYERRQRKAKFKRTGNGTSKMESETGPRRAGSSAGSDWESNSQPSSTQEGNQQALPHEAVHPDHQGETMSGGDCESPNVQTSTTNALHHVDTQNTTSAAEPGNPAEEIAGHVGRGAYKSASALAKAPVDLSVALAQGFHNAPRLYGDDTVRRPPRITGIRSGIRAAGQEFMYGIYDGCTGLVRLPVREARHGGGLRGLVTGVGMGVTGFVLKDIAAIVGPVGYTLKGVVKQVERRRQPTKYIRRARMLQGQREAQALPRDQCEAAAREVIRGWEAMRALWEALELDERRKGGVGRRLGARRRRGLGTAFESVSTAEKALSTIKGRGENRPVLDKSTNHKNSHETIQCAISRVDDHGAGQDKAHRTTPSSENQPCDGSKYRQQPVSTQSKQLNDDQVRVEQDGTIGACPLDNSKCEHDRAKHASCRLLEETSQARSSIDNPFAASAHDVAKNKEANRQAGA